MVAQVIPLAAVYETSQTLSAVSDSNHSSNRTASSADHYNNNHNVYHEEAAAGLLSSQSKASKLPGMPPNGLTFSNKILETQFIEYHCKNENQFAFRSMIVATFVGYLLVVNDFMKNAEGERKAFAVTLALIILRQLVLTGTTVVAWYLRRKDLFRKYMQQLSFALAATASVIQVLFGAIEREPLDPTYSVVIVLLASLSVTVFRLRFYYCVAINLLMFLPWLVIALLTWEGSVETLLVTFICVTVGCGVFLQYAHRREYQSRRGFLFLQRLELDEEESQEVLQRMLPKSVIAELRKGVEFIFREHDNVSVLFSHIVDFDRHTARMEAYHVVKLLNNMFSTFDGITDRIDVYKVETIGDVYMVSAGCPNAMSDGMSRIACLALEMRSYVNGAFPGPTNIEQATEDELAASPKIQLQIGINTGHVIAGVVGLKYPRYRLMGDTVNVASRMSTTCTPNEIQMTAKSAQKLDRSMYYYQFKGIVKPKGKQEMKAYILVDLASNVEASGSRSPSMSLLKGGKKLSFGGVSTTDDKQNRLATLNDDIAKKMSMFNAQNSQLVGASVDLKHNKSLPSRDSNNNHANKIRHAKSVGHERSTSSNTSNSSRNNSESQNRNLTFDISSNLTRETSSGNTTTTTTTTTSATTATGSTSRSAGSTAETNDHENHYDTAVKEYLSMETGLPSFFDGHGSTFIVSAKDIALKGIYAIPRWEQVRSTQKRWQLVFHKYPILEENFRKHHYATQLGKNRTFVNRIILAILYITLFEVYALTDILENDDFTVYCILRGLSLTILVIVSGLSYFTSLYLRISQVVGAFNMIALGTTVIHNLYMLGMLESTYGVTIIFLIVSMTTHYMGLRVPYLTFSSLAIMTFLFVLTEFGALVGVMLLLANCLNIVSAIHEEYHARKNFIKHQLSLNEEKRLRIFANEMLPPHVLEELKQQAVQNQQGDTRHSFIVHEIHEASVMFSDIVNFTKLSSSIPPEDVVAILNVMFGMFDSCMILHHVYKVETIGDAYVACSGVVDRSEWHTQNLVRFAYDAQRRVSFFQAVNGKPIQLRIGIHTGYVVAGVVGRKMPRYHLFGKTVTLAEEMESHGIPTKVLISGQTHRRLSKGVECVKLDDLFVKEVTLERYMVIAIAGMPMLSATNTTSKNMFGNSTQEKLVALFRRAETKEHKNEAQQVKSPHSSRSRRGHNRVHTLETAALGALRAVEMMGKKHGESRELKHVKHMVYVNKWIQKVKLRREQTLAMSRASSLPISASPKHGGPRINLPEDDNIPALDADLMSPTQKQRHSKALDFKINSRLASLAEFDSEDHSTFNIDDLTKNLHLPDTPIARSNSLNFSKQRPYAVFDVNTVNEETSPDFVATRSSESVASTAMHMRQMGMDLLSDDPSDDLL